MRKFWSWLGLNLGKYANVVGVVGLLVTLILGIGMVKLKFVTSNSSYLNSTDLAQQENTSYEKNFGGDPMVVMISATKGNTIDNLFTASNVKQIQGVEDKLSKLPEVFSVASPLDALELTHNLMKSPTGNPIDSPAAGMLLYAYQHDPSPTSQKVRLNYLLKSSAQLSSIPSSQQVLSNPRWVHILTHNPDGSLRTSSSSFFPNNTHSNILIFLKGGLSIDQEAAAAKVVESVTGNLHLQNATTLTTGVPALLNTINNYLKGGMLILSAIAGLIMIIILILLFSVRWRLLPFIVIAIGLVWAFGIAGYFSIPLTLASIAGLPVLMGVGLDYAIQMHSRIEEEVVLDRSEHPIQEASRSLGPALLIVTFDAVFAFAALLVAKVPMIRQFGALLVVGIIAVCLGSIIGPLAILGIREYKSPTKGKDFSKGVLSKIVVFLGSLPKKTAVPFMILSLMVFFAGIYAEGKLVLQTDPINWVNPHSKAIQGILALKSGTGSNDLMGVDIHTNQPFTNQAVNYDINLSNYIQSNYSSQVFRGTGIVNIIYLFTNQPGENPVNPTGGEVFQAYELAPKPIQHLLVANGGKNLSIIFRAKTANLSGLAPIVSTLQGPPVVSTPVGITEAPGGIAIVGVGLLENLNSSRAILTYLSVILVGLFLTIRLRSLIRAVLSLVPVIIAVGAVSIVAYIFSLKLSPMTAVAGPLVVAICTEFTSLILLRFVEERGRGRTPREAMNVTSARSGRAFIVSALTAVSGIAVMATSSMPLLRGFGIIVAMNVVVALLCALVILPPILVFAEGKGYVTRGLIKTPKLKDTANKLSDDLSIKNPIFDHSIARRN